MKYESSSLTLTRGKEYVINQEMFYVNNLFFSNLIISF